MRKTILGFALALAVICLAADFSGDTLRYRRNAILSFDPTVTLVDEDAGWTVTAKQVGYLSGVTSDLQTQISAKAGSTGNGSGLWNVRISGANIASNNVPVGLIWNAHADYGNVSNTPSLWFLGVSTARWTNSDGSSALWTTFGGSAANRAALTNLANGKGDVRNWSYLNADTVMWGTENPVIGLTGAHFISLPGAATNYGRTWAVFALGSGTNLITLPDGTTPVWTNLGTGRGARCYSDGTNWWVLGGN
jgi:hypothetical protein